jgi:hypothetical protein
VATVLNRFSVSVTLLLKDTEQVEGALLNTERVSCIGIRLLWEGTGCRMGRIQWYRHPVSDLE